MRPGRRVGVTATSHKAIHNLLGEVEQAAHEEGVSIPRPQEGYDGNEESRLRRRLDHQRERHRGLRRRRRDVAALRRHRLALRPRATSTAATLDRHPGDRRGRPGVAGRRARHGDRGAQRRPARRSAPARPGLAGHASAGHRARRCSSTCSATHATIPPDRGRLPRAHAPHAPGRVPLHLRDRLREPAGSVYRSCARQAHRVRRRGCASCRSTTPATRRRRPRRRTRSPPRSREMLGRRVDRSGRPDATARARRLHGGRALQRPGATAARGAARGRPRRGAGRHGRQVPGPGGARRLLLDGDLERARTCRAAWSSSSRATA